MARDRLSDLTDEELILYLLSLQEAKEKMQGIIRTKEKCPVCHKSFKEIPRAGFICKRHRTVPRRFFIDLWQNEKRYKIYVDDKGSPLDSYSKTRDLLNSINTDIQNKTFDASNYKRSVREQYYLINRLNSYKNLKRGSRYLRQIKFSEHYIYSYFNHSQDIRDIKQSDVALWTEKLDSYSKKGLNGKSKKNIIGILLACLNYYHSIGVIPQKLHMPKIVCVEKKLKDIPELVDTFKIIRKLNVSDEEKIIYLFLATHACRLSEARAIQAQDFNFSKKQVTICRSLVGSKPKDSNKTENPYVIPIHRDLIERLRLLCVKRNPEDIVFRYQDKVWGETTLRKKWNEAREKAGFKYQLYKGVKHACLSELADQTGQIRNVSKFAGHSNTSTTEKYAQRVDIENLRKMQSLISVPSDL